IDTVFPERPHCLEINNFVMREVERLQPKQVFLHANWRDYKKEAATINVQKTISRIKDVSPATRIVVIGNPPRWEPTLPIYAVRKGVSLNQEQYLFMPDFKRLEKIDKDLALLASKNDVVFLSALNKLCLNEKCLAVIAYETGFQLTAWDHAHLTEASSLLLAKKLLEENKSQSKHYIAGNASVSSE
ncbi:MAG TPA: SGNH hydrolase domain-containing protein, partial [Gammaproteobacteria bacterium]